MQDGEEPNREMAGSRHAQYNGLCDDRASRKSQFQIEERDDDASDFPCRPACNQGQQSPGGIADGNQHCDRHQDHRHNAQCLIVAVQADEPVDYQDRSPGNGNSFQLLLAGKFVRNLSNSQHSIAAIRFGRSIQPDNNCRHQSRLVDEQSVK